MKKLLILALTISAIASVSAQSKETRTVVINQSFDGINIAGTQNVYFEIGPAGQPITLVGDPADLDNTVITVNNGTLNVAFKKGYRSKTKQSVQVYLKNPTLAKGSVSGTGTLDIKGSLDSSKNSFRVSGTGSIYVQKIDCNQLDCKVSGTGSISCPVTVADEIEATVSGTGSIDLKEIRSEEINIVSSGTGSIKMSGVCKTGQYRTSGTGSIYAEDLKAVDVNATSSGTGNVYCYGTGNFEGKVSGTGNIYLYGNPAGVKFNGNSKKLIQR